MGTINSVNILDGNVYLTENASNVESTQQYSQLSFEDVLNSQKTESLDDIFQDVSKEYGVDINLLRAVAQAESGFDTEAVSSCGAQGIMQLMPFTSESLGVEDPFDARQNITGGAKLLSGLIDNYNGNVTLALAAYNAGSGAVSRYGGVPPYNETVNYIEKINNILGGALSNDSRTIDGASATDLSSTSEVDVPDILLSDGVKEDFGVTVGNNQSSLLSYDDYSRVMDTYKEILSKLLSLLSQDRDSSKSDGVYNFLSDNDLTDDVYGTDKIMSQNQSVVIEEGHSSYDVNTANVYMLNNISYEDIAKNDAMSLYQAQASVVSPLVMKLLDL
ncbi:MAG: lytic transglycosylase domain-containing protein [Lachnospira sp.]